MDNIHTIEIEDTVYDETYTAHIEKNGIAWRDINFEYHSLV